MIAAKTTRERGRVLFYYHSLNMYINNKKLPKKPYAVKILPEWSLKWDIISNILDGEIECVEYLWKDLVSEFPNFYADNFECINESESKVIFNLIVKRYFNKTKKHTIDTSKIRSKKSKRLVTVLLESKAPIRKEILIEKIWNESYDLTFDSRFYKLVERTRHLAGIDIKNVNKAYSLVS